MSDGGDNLQVAIRVRPMSAREKALNAKCIVTMETTDKGGSVWVEDPTNPDADSKNYDYNFALPDTTTQDFLWEQVGTSLLNTFWDGNLNVFDLRG